MSTDTLPAHTGARTWQSVARAIDHTILKPETVASQVARLCEEAAHYSFASVCVNATHLALAVSLLRGTPVKACTVIGFPLGATLTTAKRAEAADALRLGAQELDMVINVGALKSGERILVQNDIAAVTEVAHSYGAEVKVIIETSLLNLEEKIIACELSLAAGAEFVKTSTGFAGGGATVEDVHLLRGVVGNRAKVKASGGIRSAIDALAMLEAGADRLGTSAGLTILKDLGAPQYHSR